MERFLEPIELNDAELRAVAGGIGNVFQAAHSNQSNSANNLANLSNSANTTSGANNNSTSFGASSLNFF
jgi:hypothetical protein